MSSLALGFVVLILLHTSRPQKVASQLAVSANPTTSDSNEEGLTSTPFKIVEWDPNVTLGGTDDAAITSGYAPTPSASRTQTLIWVAENILNPIILLLGIGGNLLTMAIMTMKPFSKLTISLLLTALAMCDTATLLMIPLNKQNVRRVVGTDIRALSEVGCKVFFWSFRLAKVMASWVLVLISTERFAAVWLPHRAKTLYTRRNALVALISIMTFLGIYFAVWTHFTDRVIDGKCIPNTRTPSTEGRTKAFLIFGLSLLSFIPGSIILFLNSLIAYRLWKRRAMKQPAAGTAEQGQDQGRATVMLLGVALAFLVLTTPIAVAHMVFHAMDRNIFEATEPTMVAFREITQVLELMNSSINFYLYVLCSKGFRRMLQQIVQRPCQRNMVHPSSSIPPTQPS